MSGWTGSKQDEQESRQPTSSLRATPEEDAEEGDGRGYGPHSGNGGRDPGAARRCANVYSLHKQFNPDKIEDIAEQCRGATRGCVDCKKMAGRWDKTTRWRGFRERRRELAEKAGIPS